MQRKKRIAKKSQKQLTTAVVSVSPAPTAPATQPKEEAANPAQEAQPLPPQVAFVKILPKKRSGLVSQYSYFSNDDIKEIIEQFEMFVQLLLQLYLLTPDREIRIEAKNKIERISREKQQSLYLQGIRSFNVFLVDFKFGSSFLNTIKGYLALRAPNAGIKFDVRDHEKAISFQVAPQISVLQSPALETLTLVSQAVTRNIPMASRYILLYELSPFLQRKYVPVPTVERSERTAAKFTPADDALLYLGLTKFSSKSLSQIQQSFLMHKSLDEIRNRFKNLTRFKSPRNPIKVLKLLEVAPMSEFEERNLEKGRLWFGHSNYRLISRFFLPGRTAEFLAANDRKSAHLLAKQSSGRLVLRDQSLDSWVLDQKADFITESEAERAENRVFIDFLKELERNPAQARQLLHSNRSTDFSFYTLNLSNKNIMIGNRERNDKNLVLLGRGAAISTRFRMLEDGMLVNNHKFGDFEIPEVDNIRIGDENIETDGNDPGRRARNFSTPELMTKRLCPSTKELNEIAAKLVCRDNSSWVDGGLFKKLKMSSERGETECF